MIYIYLIIYFIIYQFYGLLWWEPLLVENLPPSIDYVIVAPILLLLVVLVIYTSLVIYLFFNASNDVSAIINFSLNSEASSFFSLNFFLHTSTSPYNEITVVSTLL